MDINTPAHLVSHLRTELELAWSKALDTDIQLQAPHAPILHAVLSFAIHLPDHITWEDALTAFEKAARRTNVVSTHWVTDSTLYITAGCDFYQSVRTDRGLASRVNSILNNVSFASMKRLQTITVRSGTSASPTSTLSAERLAEKQLQAHFLRFALRMNSFDIATALECHVGWNEIDRARCKCSLLL